MVVQLFKKYYKYKLPNNMGTIFWGYRDNLNSFNWKKYPHSYAHTGEILFIKTKLNLVCDFEVVGKSIPRGISKVLNVKSENSFYKIWVLAETIAKLKNISIWEFLKNNLVNKKKYDIKLAFQNQYELEYLNFKQYHIAIGYLKL